MKNVIFALALFLACLQASAQDSLLTVLARQNVTTFEWKGNAFQGLAWELLAGEIKKTNNVLIGEDHFFQEIPLFTSEVAKLTKFDNYICEIDPYMAKILEEKLTKAKANEAFFQKHKSAFSFYALAPEFKLLEQLAKDQVKFWGTDQITTMSDGLICEVLAGKTKNKQAKAIYEKIQAKSKEYMTKFLQNPQEPFYMLTPDFVQDIKTLLALPTLSAEEREQIEALQLSVRIYQEQNHLLRIQLMKNNFFNYLPTFYKKKNLYKYGAVHLPRGESLLKPYDIGNLAHNLAESQYEKSLHLMIVGKNGTQGSPFEGMPANTLNPEKGDLAFLQPFFKAMEGKAWHCFDLSLIRKEYEQGKLNLKNKMLIRTLLGYDYLIIIPEVTASKY